jgi:hypothetical protein
MLIFGSQECWGLEEELPRPWAALFVNTVSLQHRHIYLSYMQSAMLLQENRRLSHCDSSSMGCHIG